MQICANSTNKGDIYEDFVRGYLLVLIKIDMNYCYFSLNDFRLNNQLTPWLELVYFYYLFFHRFPINFITYFIF